MRLVAPCKGLNFKTKDIFGNSFKLSDLAGKRIMLSFFRDAACPFCNYRIYELTQKYKEWNDAGMEVVVVFSDTDDKVRELVAKRPRPFTMICDPKLKLYDRYGVEKSKMALFKAFFLNFGELWRGMRKGGKPTNNPHMTIVPADFLIDVNGEIVDLWYGQNTADHIPFERLINFASKESIHSSRQLQRELKKLRRENAALKEEVKSALNRSEDQ